MSPPSSPPIWLLSTQEIKGDIGKCGSVTASGRCEVGTAGDGAVGGVGVRGAQTVLIRPRHLTCGPLSVNVLHRRLTEAIIPVAHRDPQPSSAVGGTARLS